MAPVQDRTIAPGSPRLDSQTRAAIVEALAKAIVRELASSAANAIPEGRSA